MTIDDNVLTQLRLRLEARFEQLGEHVVKRTNGVSWHVEFPPSRHYDLVSRN